MRIEHVINQHNGDSIKGQAILYKGECYTYFDSGLTRHVFVNEARTKVIKILVDKESKEYNQEEIDIYRKADKATKAKFAKTETAYDGYVVEQEFCNPIKWDDRELTIQQMLFAQSCRQEVGWNLKGELVCFDLSEYKAW